MEAGRKLDLMDGWKLKWGGIFDEWFNSHPSLRHLLLLYEAWSAPIPANACKDSGLISSVTVDAPAPKINLNVVEAEREVDDGSDPDPPKSDSGWDPSSVAQRFIETFVQTSPHNAPSKSNNTSADEDGDQAMDSDEQHSQFDFVIDAGSRTPPRRLILSKDGKHWY